MNEIILDERIDITRLPKHVAIIMDGNGRWAKQHKLKVAIGHQAGTETLREIIRSSSNLGIEVLSLYAFSTENWGRPQSEVDSLMQLILTFFSSEIDELCNKNVCIRILGDKKALPDAQQKALQQAEKRTAQNTGLKLCIAINYGGRNEICLAAQELSRQILSGQLKAEDITEAKFAEYLYTGGLPDVDLLIRTSGEMRLSNFMLYQCAYAEFLFPEVLWPDFTVQCYLDCIVAYQKRKRRFGKREE